MSCARHTFDGGNAMSSPAESLRAAATARKERYNYGARCHAPGDCESAEVALDTALTALEATEERYEQTKDSLFEQFRNREAESEKLLTERDASIQRAEAAETELVRCQDHIRGTGNYTLEKAESWRAERDAALARVNQLTEALREIVNQTTATYEGFSVKRIARAALDSDTTEKT